MDRCAQGRRETEQCQGGSTADGHEHQHVCRLASNSPAEVREAVVEQRHRRHDPEDEVSKRAQEDVRDAQNGDQIHGPERQRGDGSDDEIARAVAHQYGRRVDVRVPNVSESEYRGSVKQRHQREEERSDPRGEPRATRNHLTDHQARNCHHNADARCAVSGG